MSRPQIVAELDALGESGLNDKASIVRIFELVGLASRDRDLRQRSIAVIDQLLVTQPSVIAEHIVEYATGSTKRAAVDVSLILQWAGSALSSDLDHGMQSKLVEAHAQLMTRVVSDEYVRPPLRRQAERHARSAIAKAFQKFPSIVDLYVSPAFLGQLFGFLATAVAAASAVDVSGLVPSVGENLSSAADAVARAYGQHILGKPRDAVTVLPVANLVIVESLLRQEQFDEVIVPLLQKAMLRSPETVVKDTLPSIIAAIQLSSPRIVLDRAALATETSLLSNLSSSNAELRHSTAVVWQKMLDCLSETPEKSVVDNLLKYVAKATTSEARTLGALVLSGALNSSVRSVGVPELAVAAAKEASETGIRALATSLSLRLNGPQSQGAQSAFEKGLSDQRIPLRREWACALLASGSSAPSALNSMLHKVWADAKGTVKLIPAAWALLVLPEFHAESSPEMFEARSYRSLSDAHLLDILASAAFVAAKPYAIHALVFVATSASETSVRKHAAHLLKELPANLELQEAIVDAISDAVGEGTNVVQVMGSVRSPEQLLRLLPLAHHKQARVRGGWIALCLKAGIDPGHLVSDHPDIIERLLEAAGSNMHASEAPGAGPREIQEAVATAAFVAPETVAPIVAKVLTAHLVPVSVSETARAILNTPDGQLWRPQQAAVRKSNKEEDWEAQVRAEVAAKKGQLTREESALLEEQTAQRAELRRREAAIESYASVAKTLAKKTVDGADTGALQWFPVAVEQLRQVARGGLGCEAARVALESLSVCLSQRFARPASVAMLLLNPRLETVIRMLYGLNPLGDSRAMDPVSLVYILPILVWVLENKAPEDEIENQEEAQLLVLSLLGSQSLVLALVPRPGLVAALINLLANASDKGAVKDCLLRVAQGVPFDEDELQVLLEAVLSPQQFLRASVLSVIDAEVDLSDYDYSPQIDIIRQASEHAAVAMQIWNENEMAYNTNTLSQLELYFGAKDAYVRDCVARAYAAAAVSTENGSSTALKRLSGLYRQLKLPPTPKFDDFGLEIKIQHVDPVTERSGILAALAEIVPSLEPRSIEALAEFLVEDAATDVPLASDALKLGRRLVDVHGQAQLDLLLPKFANGRHVVLYGWEAQHLPAGDKRLGETVEELVSSLSTTQDQKAIADCLAPLARRTDVQPVLDRCSGEVFEAPESSNRWAAAYGLAGLVEGLGLATIGDMGFVRLVEQAVEDRRDLGRREGAQYLVSALAQRLGRLFEPYALELMPSVLTGLGDGHAPVREAAADAARAVMQNTTAFGVQRQIPRALRELEAPQWRTKKGAVELLGAVAYLDPQQLTKSLNVVVPALASALGDSHREVRGAAKTALKCFGDVVQNPEVRALVQPLLAAIGDPPAKTDPALASLLRTRFVHYVDAPALALVIAVVQRGLRDRSAATKRKACQIVGNMSILAASADLVQYLPTIMPSLQVAMTDPVPATCATACKALGVLVQKLGEEQFPDVIPDMLSTLSDPARASDRWGTAQGLAEVLHGLGLAKLEQTMPQILSGLNAVDAGTRQGFAPLLLLLPTSFGASFAPYLDNLVAPMLHGLADSVDDVRETALKAGRRIVRSYASQAVDLLLPELERGLGSAAWRIRIASVELVGDLLMQLTGRDRASNGSSFEEAPPTEDGEVSDPLGTVEAATEVAEADEDYSTNLDLATAEDHPLAKLHLARGKELVSALFICRADSVPAVRQAALETWMALVPNTPRAVKSVLQALIRMIVSRLGATEIELRENASRALTELVRRVPGALPAVLPTLESMDAGDDRQGVCSALGTLIPATNTEVLHEYHSSVAKIIRTGLTDHSAATREAATQALEALDAALGDAAGDLVPGLVDQASRGDSGALAALRDMPGAFARAVPTLLELPVTAVKSHALAELAPTAGRIDLAQYVDDVVDALLPLPECSDDLDAILLVWCPEAHLLSLAKQNEMLRGTVFDRMATWYSGANDPGSGIDLLFASDWLAISISMLDDPGEKGKSAASLVGALASAASKKQLAQLSTPAYHALRLVSVPAPALAPPKFILPLFVQGLVAGTNLEREHGAMGLAEIVRRVSPETLKPMVTPITGPLIRVVGERAAPEVKAAVLYTLNELLISVPLFLRPFLPQLQRTFAKNLAETDAGVRVRAVTALAELVKHQPRVDPLARELISTTTTAEDPGIRASALTALFEVVSQAGKHLSEPVLQSIASLALEDPPEGHAALVAKLAAALAALQPDMAPSLVDDPKNLGCVYAAHALWIYAPDVAMSMTTQLIEVGIIASRSSQLTHSEAGVKLIAAAVLKGALPPSSDGVTALVNSVDKVDGRSSDTRRLALVALGALARRDRSVLDDYLDDFVPLLFAAVRDTLIPVKLAAEQTFVVLFDFIGRQDAVLFEKWFEKSKDKLQANTQRSLPDWVRRVALRHAARANESSLDSMTDGAAREEDVDELWTV